MIRYPRPTVLDEISLGAHGIIEASAGTGKTYTIEHLVVEILLATETTIDQILVITFTERAATELRKRIRLLLEKIDAAAQGSATEESTGESAESSTWILDTTARHKITQARSNYDSCSIHTIHGFFQRILTTEAFLTGRPFNQEIVDGRHAFKRACLESIREELAVPGGHDRDLELWLRARGTTLLQMEEDLHKAHGYVTHGIPIRPQYEHSAVLELIDLVSLPPLDDKDLTEGIKTLSGAGATRKKIKNLIMNLERAVQSLAQHRHPMRFILETRGPRAGTDDPFTYLLRNADPTRLRTAGLDSAARLVEEVMARTVPLKAAMLQTFLPVISKRLALDKAAHGLFDYDDMIRLVWESLDGDRGDVLARRIRGQYRYALIDEFQDTDPLQWKVFRGVFFESPRVPRSSASTCYLIGDPKQAIYAFRHADVNTYLDAVNEVRNITGGKQVDLITSYRSTPELLGILNRIFGDGDESAGYFTGRIRYPEHVLAGHPDRRLLTDEGQVAPSMILHDFPGNLDLPLKSANIVEAQVRMITDEVENLLNEKNLILMGVGKTDEPPNRTILEKDIYVLTRTNPDAAAVARSLRQRGISCSLYKQDGLFQEAEAQHILDLLRAIASPASSVLRKIAWMSPFFAVPLDHVLDVDRAPETHPLKLRFQEWNALALRRDYETLFNRLLDQSGLILRELYLHQSERSITNYQHIFEILLQDGRRDELSISEVVRRLEGFVSGEEVPAGEDGNLQRLETDSDAVQIMTVHKSKGLESEIVFLCVGPDSVRTSNSEMKCVTHDSGEKFLHIGKEEDIHEIVCRGADQEARRLYYVGLTRAKFRLYVPRFDPNQMSVAGDYSPMNRRLNDLDLAGGTVEIRAAYPEPSNPPPRRHPPQTPPRTEVESEESRTDPDEFRELLDAHAAFRVTSYSRLSHGHVHQSGPVETTELREDRATPDPLEDPRTRLPGGIATGLFLHQAIEDLDFGSFKLADLFDAWAIQPPVRSVFELAMRKNGIAPHHLEEGMRVVYRTLTTPLQVLSNRVPSFHEQATHIKEMEFTYPIPEEDHPRLDEPVSERLVIHRGFVKGVIDYLFVHEDKVYFVDWKGDRLKDYGPAGLSAHVAANYDLQARLYTLAVVKMLHIQDESSYDDRFGGLMYCFLRGLREPDGPHQEGLFFQRPTWSQVRDWERSLIGVATA